MLEKARWALDKYQVSYLEKCYPYGFHLWESLKFSDVSSEQQCTSVPIYSIPAKKEVTRVKKKHNSSCIWLYLYIY